MAFPPAATSRVIRGVHEVVTIEWEGEWVQGITHLSRKRRESLESEAYYKRTLARVAGYPEDESWRIVTIRPLNAGKKSLGTVHLQEFLVLEITFLNPGKAFEQWVVHNDKEGFYVSEEVKTLLRAGLNKNNGVTRNGTETTVREVREEHESSQPPS